MGIFWDLDQPAKERQAQRIGGLLGESVTSEMSGSSMEFDENGNPINIRQQAPQIYDRQGTGFLGSDRGALEQMKLNAGLQTVGGLDAGQAQQVMASQTGLNNAQYDAISALNKNMNESSGKQLERVNKLRTPYVKAMIAPRKAMNNYNDAVDIIDNAEWKNKDRPMLTGAESVTLVKKFLKQVLPDESVMGDDIQTLLSSQGVSEQYKSLVNRFLGDSGTITKTGAQEIMKAMATMAQSGGDQRDLLRNQYKTEAEQYQLPTTFMGNRINIKQNPLSFEAWKKSQGY